VGIHRGARLAAPPRGEDVWVYLGRRVKPHAADHPGGLAALQKIWVRAGRGGRIGTMVVHAGKRPNVSSSPSTSPAVGNKRSCGMRGLLVVAPSGREPRPYGPLTFFP
jgi:hypothetical protein